MAVYKYAPYYQYNGPTHSQPLREELPPDEAARRLSLFFEEVGNYFDDVGAEVEPVDTDVISITTELSQAECDERVKRCLNSLDLYARKVPIGS